MQNLDFTQEQLKLIFRAVRYYQINKVALNGKEYQECDTILNQIFPVNIQEQNESGKH